MQQTNWSDSNWIQANEGFHQDAMETSIGDWNAVDKSRWGEVHYYDSIQMLIDLKGTAEVKTDNDFVWSKDDFLRKFNWIYWEEKLKPNNQQNMMIALVEAYIAKLTSRHNPVVHTKAMNLCLTINAKSPKTYNLIAANTPLVAEIHIHCVSTKNREQSLYLAVRSNWLKFWQSISSWCVIITVTTLWSDTFGRCGCNSFSEGIPSIAWCWCCGCRSQAKSLDGDWQWWQRRYQEVHCWMPSLVGNVGVASRRRDPPNDMSSWHAPAYRRHVKNFGPTFGKNMSSEHAKRHVTEDT